MGQLSLVQLGGVAREVSTEGVQHLQTCGKRVHRCLEGAPDLLQGSVVVDPRGLKKVALNKRLEHPQGVVVLDYRVEASACVVKPASWLVAKEAPEEVVIFRFERPLAGRVEIKELVNVDDYLCGDGVIFFQTGEVLLALMGAVVAGGEVMPGVAWVEHQVVKGDGEANGGGHIDCVIGEGC